jgi:glutamine kinase
MPKKVLMILSKEFSTDPRVNKEAASLIENGIKSNSRDLITFIRESIEGREYSKFVFTKSLSKIIKKIEEFGLNNDVSREDLAFLDFQVIKELYASLNHLDIKEIFMSNINKNKAFYEFTESVKLPSVILSPDDIYHFSLFAEEPNFITLKKITENVVMESDIRKNKKIQNKVVFIESADPGYDFLFSKDIGGLVTQYGGANSHMAIRCAELGIPAVIGAGEKNFKEWSDGELIEIDCSNKQVTIIK